MQRTDEYKVLETVSLLSTRGCLSVATRVHDKEWSGGLTALCDAATWPQLLRAAQSWLPLSRSALRLIEEHTK